MWGSQSWLHSWPIFRQSTPAGKPAAPLKTTDDRQCEVAQAFSLRCWTG
jgi:hypothetical protein